jgi:hypothetical protein
MTPERRASLTEFVQASKEAGYGGMTNRLMDALSRLGAQSASGLASDLATALLEATDLRRDPGGGFSHSGAGPHTTGGSGIASHGVAVIGGGAGGSGTLHHHPAVGVGPSGKSQWTPPTPEPLVGPATMYAAGGHDGRSWSREVQMCRACGAVSDDPQFEANHQCRVQEP